MIERKPLRTQVQQEILARITDHRLPAGARINESHLSAELGISRTPLREAMLGLEAVGFLASDLGRGFLVPPLSAVEFSRLQAVLGRLAPFALAAALPLATGAVMELNNLLGRSRLRITQAGPAGAAGLADLVHGWTTLCVAGCPNAILVADINRLSALSRRCWRAAGGRGFDATEMLADYGRLYELLRARHADAAVLHWENHIARYAAEAARRLPATTEDS